MLTFVSLQLAVIVPLAELAERKKEKQEGRGR
jgi:hypothetical protein